MPTGTCAGFHLGGDLRCLGPEVVFENGEAQVIDFNDSTHRKGLYSLLDFKDGRKVDHIRFVAKADTEDATIRVHLVS